MDIVYVDILTGEIYRQLRLLIGTSFNDQFVHLKDKRGWGNRVDWDIVILASCLYHFIKVHGNLVKHPISYLTVMK